MRQDIAKALAEHITKRPCTLRQSLGRCAIFIDLFETTHFYGGTWKAAVKCLERNWSRFQSEYPLEIAAESTYSASHDGEAASNSTASDKQNQIV